MPDSTSVPAAPAAATPSGGQYPVRHPRFAAWMLVARQTLLPLVVATFTVIVFGRLGQAQEALFGTIGVAPSPGQGVPDPFGRYIGAQFSALAVAIALLGATVWYAARLLLTVDSATQRRLAGMAVRRHASGPVEEGPRLLGAATAAALVVTLLGAQAGPAVNPLLAIGVGLLLTAGPVATTMVLLHRRGMPRGRRSRLLAAQAGIWFLLACLVVRTMRPSDNAWSVAMALAALCIWPAVFYFLLVHRRRLLRRLGLNAPAPGVGLRLSLRQGAIRLLAMTLAGGAVLLLALGPLAAARALGSAAIVLLAVTAFLCLACSATLVLRWLDHGRPGILIVLAAVLLGLYVVLHAAFDWRPFRETLGSEGLAVAVSLPPETPRPSAARDIVVNAHGGGLRAALFTAQALAELDDRTCGEFGRRLARMSGVSGGSLGIAVYLVMRQDLVAAGGWGACSPGIGNPLTLTTRVGDVLLQDHLSAALARMLSIDLIIPLRPQRGQALLESWQDALLDRMESGSRIRASGMALPLHELDGGLAPGPEVYFNATRVEDGMTLWFSNRKRVGDANGSQALVDTFQVGQAVLHSARFPFVTPAGSFPPDSDALALVDGGYADNSGAATLLATATQPHERHWLNIDGNAPAGRCAVRAREGDSGVFSGLDALLAVRRSQSVLAVARHGRARQETPIDLAPDMEAGFVETITNPDERCARVRALRSAPLGWYLTPVTAGDQRLARLVAVNGACRALAPLCGK